MKILRFENYPYHRPDAEAEKKALKELLERVRGAGSASEQKEAFWAFQKKMTELRSLSAIAEIRHDGNSYDKFYEEEKLFWDGWKPALDGAQSELAGYLPKSRYRAELEESFGTYLFTKYELQKKIYSDSIAEDMAEENRLVTEYHRLLARGRALLNGKEYSLNELDALKESPQRHLRRRAHEAYFGYFAAKQDAFDEIFGALIRLRDGMAKKLGYKNFVPLAYDRLGRSDYSAKEIEGYRNEIHRIVVPIVQELKKTQARHLRLDRLAYYDLPVNFIEGNPKPVGSDEQIMKQGMKMYCAMGSEFEKFFTFMLERNLFDCFSRKGKKAGGYCHFIPSHASPFIFANFNGSFEDIDVITHEAGHAFQTYQSSRTHELPDYLWPTMDAAEIHSMSMEFLSYPWMELFFEEDADRYRFMHLKKCIEFLPYGACIDEFQHKIYENPKLNFEERRSLFREIEKHYLPHIDYSENSFLEKGGFFYKQLHIFSVPFYYIDYTLAQVCAMQFWKKAEADRKSAMAAYIRLCKAGGSKSFSELLKLADLKNPLEAGNLEASLTPISDHLKSSPLF